MTAKTTCTFLTSRKFDSVAGIASETPTRVAWQPGLSRQILKNHSGMAMMYFRLNIQRSTILIGRAAMNSSRLAITM